MKAKDTQQEARSPGRPRVYRTEKEREAAQQAALARANERRRSRYKADPDYRQMVNQRNRSQYRKSSDNPMARPQSIRKRLEKVERFATPNQKVTDLEGREHTVDTVNFQQLSDFLGIGRSSVYRWQRQGKIPMPLLRTVSGNLPVYTLDQLVALSKVIQNVCWKGRVDYYRVTDQDVVDEVYQAFAKVSLAFIS